MGYRWRSDLPAGITQDPSEPEGQTRGLNYWLEGSPVHPPETGDLGKRLSVHPDIRKVESPRDLKRTMSIKDTGPKGGIGRLIAHDADFTLGKVTQHFGNVEQAYRTIKSVGETGKGREVFLHMQGNLLGPSRDPDHLLYVDEQRKFGANPGRLFQLNKEQHGVVFDKSDRDIAQFEVEGWRGAYTESNAGLARLEDECIETASFTSAGPIYQPSNKPGC